MLYHIYKRFIIEDFENAINMPNMGLRMAAKVFLPNADKQCWADPQVSAGVPILDSTSQDVVEW